jgi:phosphoglycolate phosphatase
MINGFKDIHSIVFDFDYPLVDSSSGSIECIFYALRKMGLPVPAPETIRQTIGMSLEDALKQLAGVDNQGSQEEFRALFTHRADEVMLERTNLLAALNRSSKILNAAT